MKKMHILGLCSFALAQICNADSEHASDIRRSFGEESRKDLSKKAIRGSERRSKVLTESLEEAPEEATLQERMIGVVSGICGISSLLSVAMYTNDWGSMRSKVSSSPLGERGFKMLAGPLFFASCFGLYSSWSAPRKRMERELARIRAMS